MQVLRGGLKIIELKKSLRIQNDVPVILWLFYDCFKPRYALKNFQKYAINVFAVCKNIFFAFSFKIEIIAVFLHSAKGDALQKT